MVMAMNRQQTPDHANRRTKHLQPDNLPTWSVIIGCLLAVIFILGASYSLSGLAQALAFLSIVAYIATLQIGARVNIFRILWGGTIAEHEHVNRPLVVRATIAMSLLAFVWLAWDLLTETSWGFFSWAGVAIAITYVILIVRAPRDTSENRE